MNRNDLYRKALSVFPYCTHGLDNDGQVIIYTGINPDLYTDTTDGFHCYSTCRCGSGPWTNKGDEGCKCGYADEQSDTDTTDGFHCYSTCCCGNNGDEDCKCGYTDEQSDIALLFETVNDVILRIEQLEQEASDEGTD